MEVASDAPAPGARKLGRTAPLASGTAATLSGLAVLAGTAVAARIGVSVLAIGTIPLAGVLIAMGAGRSLARRHPDEPWLPGWLVAGVLYKITLSYLRFVTVVSVGNGNSDSEVYDKFGRRFALFWQGDGPNPDLVDLRKTNFVRWFTGVVYYAFGTHIMAGYFAFGLLALIGSYFWYRATVEAVPFIDKRLYLAFVLFAPSIAFWPSSIGKEALMQLALGTAALGIALMLNHRLITGLAIASAGGWLMWVARPHLLALVALAGAVSYFVGRVRRSDEKESGPLAVFVRPIGMIIVAFLLVFTINQGAQFLGLTDLSLNSIQGELDATTVSTGQGDSSFNSGGNSLNPINLPIGVTTVLLRPFPWETSSPFQLLASLESVVLIGFIVVRFSSIKFALRKARSTPFILFCWVLTLLYAMTFSSFANFGLLVRQRSLVLPALFVLIAIDPVLAARRELSDAPSKVGPTPRVFH